MGSNSSKNSSFSPDTATRQNSNTEELNITPLSKKKNILDTFEDPRSPTIQHRTPLSSPAPARSWRALAGEIDPRSPSLNRTPTLEAVRYSEIFDPRSPSLNRTPVGDLTSSEEVAFEKDVVSSPYVVGRAISLSVSMEEPVNPSEQKEQVQEEREVNEINAEGQEDATLIEQDQKQRKDGASVCLDVSMQLNNSNNIEQNESFQNTAMQSIEIINPQASTSEIDAKKEDLVIKKRKKDTKRDSLASSPLKKSYSPMMNENEHVYLQKQQLKAPSTPRSPLSTLSNNRRSSLTPLDKPRLFTETVPSIAL